MRTVRLTGLLCALLSSGFAQRDTLDAKKVYQLGDVVVTATRSPIIISDSPSAVEMVTHRQIQDANGSTVADLLQNYTSIFIKDQGATSALKTISLRGTASEHLLVLINGNRINSFQNGLVDLSLLPSNDIERIEIVRSGSSAFYGADALGGVLNILTRQSSGQWKSRAEVSAGSFGFEREFLEGQGGVGPVRILTGYSAERGRDDYSFRSDLASSPDEESHRANSDFIRRQVYLHGTVEAGEHSLLTLSTAYVLADRGVPGDLRFSSGKARQNDKDANVLLGYTVNQSDDLQVSLRSGLHYNFETYVDRDFFIDSYYKNLFLNFNPEVRIKFGEGDRLLVGGEIARGTLVGNDFDDRISRVQKSLYASNEIQLESDRNSFDRIALYQTLRYDAFSDVDRALTPKLGVNVRVLREGDLRLRSSIGRNFRAPSFNDLYYRGFSNPNLKPERSTSFDIGGMGGFNFFGSHHLEVTYFHLSTRDRILFDLTTYLPVNIGASVSRGLELDYQGSFFEKRLEAKVNYTLSDARKTNKSSEMDPSFEKQLLFIPKDVLNISLSARLDPVSVVFGHSFVGKRYIVDDHSQWLPSYHLTRANVAFRFSVEGLSVLLKGEVNNLFDRNYEVFPYYPMPGRNYRFTVGVGS